MPTAKRKTTAKKPAVRPVAVKASAPLDKIAAECRKRFGWDPRITVYETDERKIDKMRLDKDNFTYQHARFSEQVILFGYKIQEVGALAHPTTRANQRIVQVSLPETE